MAKNNAGKALGAAAVTAGLAAAIAKLEEQAKAEGRDILDVVKDKINDVVEDVKSGEAVDKATALADKLANDITSGDILDAASDKFNTLVDDVKSGKFADDATKFATSVKEGVVDMFDGDGTNAKPEAPVETAEAPAPAVEEDKPAE